MSIARVLPEIIRRSYIPCPRQDYQPNNAVDAYLRKAGETKERTVLLPEDTRRAKAADSQALLNTGSREGRPGTIERDRPLERKRRPRLEPTRDKGITIYRPTRRLARFSHTILSGPRLEVSKPDIYGVSDA